MAAAWDRLAGGMDVSGAYFGDLPSPVTPATPWAAGGVSMARREVVCLPLIEYQRSMGRLSRMSSLGSSVASFEATGAKARPPHAMLCWVSDLATPAAREDLVVYLRQMQDCSRAVRTSGSSSTTPRHTPPVLQFFTVCRTRGEFRCRRKRSRSHPAARPSTTAAGSGSAHHNNSPRAQGTRKPGSLRQPVPIAPRVDASGRKQYPFQARVSFGDDPASRGLMDVPLAAAQGAAAGGGKDAGKRVHRYPTKGAGVGGEQRGSVREAPPGLRAGGGGHNIPIPHRGGGAGHPPTPGDASSGRRLTGTFPPPQPHGRTPSNSPGSPDGRASLRKHASVISAGSGSVETCSLASSTQASHTPFDMHADTRRSPHLPGGVHAAAGGGAGGAGGGTKPRSHSTLIPVLPDVPLPLGRGSFGSAAGGAGGEGSRDEQSLLNLLQMDTPTPSAVGHTEGGSSQLRTPAGRGKPFFAPSVTSPVTEDSVDGTPTPTPPQLAAVFPSSDAGSSPAAPSAAGSARAPPPHQQAAGDKDSQASTAQHAPPSSALDNGSGSRFGMERADTSGGGGAPEGDLGASVTTPSTTDGNTPRAAPATPTSARRGANARQPTNAERARSCGVPRRSAAANAATTTTGKAGSRKAGAVGGASPAERAEPVYPRRRRGSNNWETDAISQAACGRYESESLLVLTDSDAPLVELPQVLKALLPTNNVEVILLASVWRDEAVNNGFRTAVSPRGGNIPTTVVAHFAPTRPMQYHSGTPRSERAGPAAWPRQVPINRSPAIPPSSQPLPMPSQALHPSPTHAVGSAPGAFGGSSATMKPPVRRSSFAAFPGARDGSGSQSDRRASMYRVVDERGTWVTTEFEQVWEHERWYPMVGWRSPVLPGDPRKFDRDMAAVSTPDGWTWSTEWYIAGDDAGWEYSGRFGRHWTRGKPEKTFSFARRRRWLRHRQKRTAERVFSGTPQGGSVHGAQEFSAIMVSSSPLFSTSIATLQEDFFPSGAGGTRVPAAELGAFTKVRNAMKEALCKPPKMNRAVNSRQDRRQDTFTGKEALEWMLNEGLNLLPIAALPTLGTPRTPRTPRQQRKRDREHREYDAMKDRRRDPRFILESMRLQGLLACADLTRSAGLFRDDNTLYYLQEESTDPTMLFEKVLTTLSPQLHMLSDLSFDTSSSWFKSVSNSVAQSNKITDDFASQHRHRWKSKSHQCYHCSDRLVEDAVLKLFCGHTICYECVKVHLRHQQEYCKNTGIGDYEEVVKNLVICKVCHTPSSLNISTSSIGLTQYDVDRTALFAYQVEEVFENQRRRIGGKFKKDHLLPSDRSAYSDAAGRVRYPTAHDITLPGPEWQWAEHWQKQKGGNTDSSGWQYAFSWGPNDWRDGAWRSHPTSITFVRRRLLRRLRINGPGTMFLREQLKNEIHRRYGPLSVDPASPYFLRNSVSSTSSQIGF